MSLIEEIRRAEKDVMEARERLLRTDDRGPAYRIGSNPTREKYSLFCPRTFVDNANEGKKGEYTICRVRACPVVILFKSGARNDDDDDGKGSDGDGGGSDQRPRVYGIHGELRRLRLRLNRERPK